MMSFPDVRVIALVRYVAEHPRCPEQDAIEYCTQDGDLDATRDAVQRAVRAVLIDRSVIARPAYLTCTARGFRMIEPPVSS